MKEFEKSKPKEQPLPFVSEQLKKGSPGKDDVPEKKE